jgi:CPA1 family monovalent cation:H+ antiporter
MAASIELLIAAFLGIVMFASIVSLRAKVPYTLVLVFFGMGIAAVISARMIAGHQIPGIMESLRTAIYTPFTSQSGSSLFVGLVVPPLIFEAMMHTKSADLRSVIRPSVVLATVGVIIATVVGGLALWKIGGLPAPVSFLFAAAIAPTDAATVLEVFRRSKVPSKLATLMDTEAAFNDATGIVVFSVVLTSIQIPKISLIHNAIAFGYLFGGGVVVGLAISFVAELLTSLITDKLSETMLTIATVYGSYAVASAVGASGLVAVSVAGLYFGNLTTRSAMGPSTREAVDLFWQIAAFIANSIAFLFIGFSTNFVEFASNIYEILGAFLAVTLARIASVYPILTLFDRFGKEKIPMKWRNVATIGGMRGALSIALVASIPASAAISTAEVGTINTLVLGVAFI